MLQPLALPPGLSVRQALERVLRLPAVASKRYLTNKVLPVPRLCPLSPALPPLCSPTPGGGCRGPPVPREKRQEQGSHLDGLVPCCHLPSLVCSG